MGFGFQGDNTLDVFYLEEVGFGVVCRCKLLDNRTFGKGYVVFVGRYNLVRILLGGFLNHLEEGRFLFHSVDDKCTAEDFVAAVLGIDLCKAEYFGVGQRTSQVLFYFLEVIHFRLWRVPGLLSHCMPPDPRCGVIGSGWRLVVNTVLVEAFIHALQHRVAVCVFVFYGEIFFDTGDTAQTHILGDFHSIGTPRGNHFAARTYEMSFQVVFTFGGGFSKKPAEFVAVCLSKFVVTFYGNHALGWCSEKKGSYFYLRVYDLQITVEAAK